jgi:integrase/recombinase XerD
MTQLAPTLEAYFTLRLIGQRQASPHTVASYRDAFKLLLAFAAQQTGRPPSRLQLEDLDAKLIGAFLDHLETERANAVRTRNARLAALHSMFRFAALRHPEHAALIARVLAIPPKRTDRAIVQFLSEDEIDALLASPDRSRWIGRRDHALLLVAIETGLRVSELVGLRCQDVVLGSGAHVRCFGKGRKERVTPLTAPTVAVLRAWLQERHGEPSEPLFPASRGGPLSRDAIERLLAKYCATAAQACPTLLGKKLAPHVLRHSCAVQLRRAGVDQATLALWLGHFSHDRHLQPCRPLHQGAGPGTHQATRRRPGTLQAVRHPARLPRRPVIMPTQSAHQGRPGWHLSAGSA